MQLMPGAGVASPAPASLAGRTLELGRDVPLLPFFWALDLLWQMRHIAAQPQWREESFSAC